MIITGRICRKLSNKLPVKKKLIYSQSENICPARATRCTDSREIWHYQEVRESASPYEISCQSVRGVCNAAPKTEKSPLFGIDSPCRGEPFDRFLKLLGALIHTAVLH